MAQPAPTLDPTLIPKYVNQLTTPPIWVPTLGKDCGNVIRQDFTIAATEFYQQILPPGFPKTKAWGYAGNAKNPGSSTVFYFQGTPGGTFEATRGLPIQVRWQNKLTGYHIFPVDPTIHWANPNNMPMPMPPFLPYPPGYPQAQSPIPIVTHLHGGEDRSDSDGHPDAWFTANGKFGPAWTPNPFFYPNQQNPTTLWYHDHSLGMTRLNVQAGLVGAYILRDPKNPLDSSCTPLPTGKYEIPLILQDHSFNTDGSFFFTEVGDNPDIHPYWDPEFFGNVITVNGKAWPNLNVERRQYRFRIVNGSNARFYHMFLSNGQSFTQIGSDGGYLPKPVTLTAAMVAPAERIDILIDFSKVAPGTKIILQNDSVAPFPSGDPVDPNTTGQIMQFTVMGTIAVSPAPLPAVLNTLPVLTPNAPKRTLVLFEVEDPATGNPVIVTLNGQRWFNPVSELPRVGSTEDWELINLTDDTHPIHIHLIQFQVLNRQAIDRDRYTADWVALNGQPPLDHPTIVLNPTPYLQGTPVPPDPNERGWKDTIRVNPDTVAPGAVTRIRVRFAPQNADPAKAQPGVNLFPFDPTFGPGYVWHCHILDHEDNEMMRPYKVVK
ncbi:MAG TPA: multicopper oxidase [Bacillota bacterium]|nr:multicopper oxidase [Bacillota bacterium]